MAETFFYQQQSWNVYQNLSRWIHAGFLQSDFFRTFSIGEMMIDTRF